MLNPYEPPRSAPDLPPPVRGFRWRLIHAAFLILVGGVVLVAFSWALATLLLDARDLATELGSRATRNLLLLDFAGVLWILGGLTFWERKWWQGVACLIGGVGSVTLAVLLGN